jgi:hypothetical protein
MHASYCLAFDLLHLLFASAILAAGVLIHIRYRVEPTAHRCTVLANCDLHIEDMLLYSGSGLFARGRKGRPSYTIKSRASQKTETVGS